MSDLPESEWRAKDLVPHDSPVDIVQRPQKNNKELLQVSCCSTCKSNAKIGRKLHLFDDFSKQPPQFTSLVSYMQYRKLSIGNLYCSTFKNPGYSYLHAVGNISISRNTGENLRGMVGMLQEGSDPELEVGNEDVKKCVLWLKKNNPLYKGFMQI